MTEETALKILDAIQSCESRITEIAIVVSVILLSIYGILVFRGSKK